MKGIVVLGSTGSIGRQTLDIVRAFPRRLKVMGLAAGSNFTLLKQQVEEFHPRMVWCADGCDRVGPLPQGSAFVPMDEMAVQPDVGLVMMATTGRAGLVPTLRALEARKPVALANKEVVVMAGELVMATAKRCGTPILAVDSEPSAIWQCLRGEGHRRLRRIIITASGGAFRDRPAESLHTVTPEEALKHPTWVMGKKITIDSASLMNKAFEVVEVHWLFDAPWEKIDVVIHPQSVVHSMVEFEDGVMKAQLGPPDMRLPIQHALFYPDRLPNQALPKLDTSAALSLDFRPLDTGRYPCFPMALATARRGGTYPAVLSAADEVAVELFLARRARFTDIPRIVERVVSEHTDSREATLESILQADEWARARTRELVGV